MFFEGRGIRDRTTDPVGTDLNTERRIFDNPQRRQEFHELAEKIREINQAITVQGNSGDGDGDVFTRIEQTPEEAEELKQEALSAAAERDPEGKKSK